MTFSLFIRYFQFASFATLEDLPDVSCLNGSGLTPAGDPSNNLRYERVGICTLETSWRSRACTCI